MQLPCSVDRFFEEFNVRPSELHLLWLLGLRVGEIQSVLEQGCRRHGEVLLFAQLQDLLWVLGGVVQVESLRCPEQLVLSSMELVGAW